MDLFDHALEERMQHEAPLADRMRPQTLDEIVGQDHIIGEGRLLRRAIQADRLFSSIILYGPPGTGKTTLARVISNLTKAHFESLSAVLAGVADLRKVIAEATERRRALSAAGRFSLLMKCIAGTRPSRMHCFPMWKADW